MPVIEYRTEDRVAIITLNDGENRFNPPFLQAFLDTLDEIEEKTDANALVVTSSHEKIFSNGIDLEWLLARHTCINNWRLQGHDFFRIMVASGHKTMAVFKRYNRVSEEGLKSLANPCMLSCPSLFSQ
jgi:enoyl-CoA hydratase/carnithine racemase